MIHGEISGVVNGVIKGEIIGVENGVKKGEENGVISGDILGVMIGVENGVLNGDENGVLNGVSTRVRATVRAVGGLLNVGLVYLLHELVVLYGRAVIGVA